MKHLTNHDLKELIGKNEPCLTVYAPLEGDLSKDIQTLQSMLNEACDHARNTFPIVSPHFDGLSAKNVLGEQSDQYQNKGVAIFKSPTFLGIRLMHQKIDPLIVVSDSFHLKPFFNYLQVENRYMAICLDSDRVRLYRGDQMGIESVSEFRSATVVHLTPSRQAFEPITRHGGRFNNQETMRMERSILRFFKRIDNDIRRHYITSNIPVILVGPTRLTQLYRNVNKHRSAVIATIPHSQPTGPMPGDIHHQTLQILEEFHQRRALKGTFEFRYTKPFGRAIDNMSKIAEAAVRGEIKSLMIRSGASVWGRVSRRTGKVLVQDKQASQISDDILDDIGELVLKNQGEVFVIPARDMPTNEPLAAILQPKPIAS